jgi:uncharacterized membrane protein
MIAQALFRTTLGIGSRRLHLAVVIAMIAIIPIGVFVTGFVQLAVVAGVLVGFVVLIQRQPSTSTESPSL